MPKWTYSITIINNTDRELELVSSSVPWGYKEKAFPRTIGVHEKGEFKVYSPAGAPYGLEFYFSLRDKPKTSEEGMYGSISFSVDMPYWQHENHSDLICTGMLKQDGFQKVPDGNHDFATTATISTTNMEEPKVYGDTAEYSNRYDWRAVEALDIADSDDVNIDSLIPDKNILSTRKAVLRSDISSISKNMWSQIKDKKYPEVYNKRDFVSDYFTVMIYELRKNKTISIAANQSYYKSIEITNRSTVRRETREELHIENVINGGFSDGLTLSEELRVQYQISNLSEYCEEDMKTVREEFNYEATDYDRNVVLWDLARVLTLYRIDKKGNIELIGVDDYYLTDSQKTYISGDKSETSEADFECANSQETFSIDDDILTYIAGRIQINHIDYNWQEKSFGGLNRGMLYNPGRHQYKFTPNPHEDPAYNRNQVRWYQAMAREFQRVGNGTWTRDNWSDTIRNLVVNGITYTATTR